MGFKLKMGRAASILALLAWAVVADAASPEPLVVTALSDPEVHLVVQSAGGSENSGLDPAMEDFASAISEAAASERQSIAARCKSIATIPARGAIRAAWETHCRYQRR